MQLKIQVIATHITSPSPTFLPTRPQNEYKAILTEFPAVTHPCSSEQPVKHNITWLIISLPQALLSPLIPDASFQNDLLSLVKSSIVCSSSVLSTRPLAIGLRHCIWFPRKMVTGALVLIIELWTTLLLPIAIQYHTFKTLPHHCMAPLPSPQSIWSERTTRSLLSQLMSWKHQQV